MPKASSADSLLEILDQLNKFLDDLKKESFGHCKRQELRDFLLTYVNQLQLLKVEELEYDYKEVRKKYITVCIKFNAIPLRGVFRLNQSGKDNQYDSVIIGLFEKIFSVLNVRFQFSKFCPTISLIL